MKTLRQACTPRASVFDSTKRDTVPDILDLAKGKIDPVEFFAENFATQGMRTLLSEAFKRLDGGAQAQGIFRLSQSMGGGKTHNLIALGLLAAHPEWREKVMSSFYTPKKSLGPVRVAAFSGRYTDAPFGIWGEIAKQLGKEQDFAPYYSPLAAPGQEAWIKLLSGEPLVILLDELPPYFAYAGTREIGTGTLADVTTAALANLMVAVGDNKLSNVVLVMTDLSGASYQQGQEKIDDMLRSVENLAALKDLGNEAIRLSMPIDPVRINTDEFYHILRTRLFEQTPDEEDIREIAQGYAQALKAAKLMDITSASPEQFAADIESSYPFHPAIRDLYARFKENQGFQQTRALIRIMRVIAARMWGGAAGGRGKADSAFLIGAHDLDLTDAEMVSEVKQINGKLEPAIAHDIETTGGSAVAQVLDKDTATPDAEDVSRLLFLSSLTTSMNQLLGLNRSEIVAYLAAPGRDVSRVARDVIDNLQNSAWYLHASRDGRLYFKDTQNINAKLESYTRSMLKDSKEKELRVQLEKIFAPKMKDCYQRLLCLPALDEIQLTQDAVALVVFRPSDGALATIRQFQEQATFKNRVCFLTGDANTYERVLDAASRIRAISAILDEMRGEGRPDGDPQVQDALSILDKLSAKLYFAVKSTFLTLYYPTRDGLTKSDMDFQYTDHKFEAEEQIRKALEAAYKYTTDVGAEGTFRKKVENKLWPQGKQETPWSQIKTNAAQDGSWNWHVPNALDQLKAILAQRDQWRESEGYVDKGPFPQPATEVRVQVVRRDDETGKVMLKVTPIHGDRVYMEKGGAQATTASRLLNDEMVEVDGLDYSFVAVDSAKVHEAGAAAAWSNVVTIKHRFFQDGDHMRCELKAAPPVPMKYTTDGSNPVANGGAYTEPFIVPTGARFVQAVPANGKGKTEQFGIPAEAEKVIIDPAKPYFWHRTFQRDSTMETFNFIEVCRRHDARLGGININVGGNKHWADLNLDPDTYHGVDEVVQAIEMLQGFVHQGAVTLKTTTLNVESGQSLLDLVADLKTEIKQGEAKIAEPRK